MSFIQRPGNLALARVPDPSELLNPDQIAVALGIVTGVPTSSSAVSQASKRPDGPPPVFLGGVLFLKWSDALAWHTGRRELRGRRSRYAATASLREPLDRHETIYTTEIGANA